MRPQSRRNIAYGVAASAILMLYACGPDVLSAAGSGASAAAASAKQGQEQKAHMQAQIKAAQEAGQKHAGEVAEEADRAAR